MQKICVSSALAIELRLSCINPSIWQWYYMHYMHFLTCVNFHHWSHAAFTWAQFHGKCWTYQSISKFEDYTFKIAARSPVGQWVKWVKVSYLFLILYFTTPARDGANSTIQSGAKQSTRIGFWDQNWDIMLSLDNARWPQCNWIWYKTVGKQSCISLKLLWHGLDKLSGHML